ncbi:MAG: TonB-dependent receptor, partial [Bacteroidales bacterium]|nr:TonB-dependent receptor [Bacteroidales bacterium]
VKVTHDPSGSITGTFSNEDGWFNVPDLRAGGPYTIEISLFGYHPEVFQDITLPLGEVVTLTVSLQKSDMQLDEVTISGKPLNPNPGSTIHVAAREINTLPSINRSIEDFLLLSPYAGSGNTFAGTDGRYNSIMVDGASFNNGYGLSSKLTPGGDNAQPFSLDAVEAVQVSVAPFDIRRSHFTGADVNIVTRSGDNTFKGSAYTFLRPKSLNGHLVGDETVSNANNSSSQLYGFRLGGPIVKNKLFFFVSGEYQESPSNFLLENYGYEAGDYLNIGKLCNDNYKLLAKLNWNLGQQHKFVLRYNLVRSGSDQLVNAQSAPIRAYSDRNSANAIAFANTNYSLVDFIHSVTGEWNAIFSAKVSNKLLANYSYIRSKRNSPSALFPFVDIWEDGDQYMSFGYEPFSYGTDLVNHIVEVTDNVNIFLGKHTLTAGASFNYLGYQNNYRQYGLGYYRYNSLDDFLQGRNASVFALTYPYDENATLFRLEFGIGSAYVQDEWRPTERFTLNYGLRLEMPFYLNDLQDNPAIDALAFQDGYQMDVGSWPKSQCQLSPRIGFQWTQPHGAYTMILRGGTGLFTGFLPFVWMNEQPSLSGMMQNMVISAQGNIPFATDYQMLLQQNPDLFPMHAATQAPSKFCEVDKHFKLPQIWRSNLAFDLNMPKGFVLTLEALYSKDVNAVMQRNINEAAPVTVFAGNDNRSSWWLTDSTSQRRLVGNYDAYLITNTRKGYKCALSVELSKKFSKGLSAMVAYTYNISKNVTDNLGTSSSSRWKTNVTANSLTDETLGHSAYAVPHLVLGALSWRIEEAKHLAFTLSLIYRGSAQGRYSFVYANDMNGDGNASDLLYIPSNENDLHFVPTGTMSADEQRLAFWNTVESDPYLSKHKGGYAERNGKVGPWINRIDIRLLQDLFSNFGTNRRYTLQLSLEVSNLANLLNSRWGCYRIHGLGNASYNTLALLRYAGMDENGVPTYQLNASDISTFHDHNQWLRDVSVTSTWRCMIGLRLLF